MDKPTTIWDIRTVSVNVTDQDRAVDFYVDTLGFEQRMDADLGGGFRWIEVAAAGIDVDEIPRWPDVPPMFVLCDPDGNSLYVVESAGDGGVR